MIMTPVRLHIFLFPALLPRMAAVCLGLLFAAAGAQAQIFPSFGEERTGTSIVNTLKIGPGARAAAMGEAFTAVADDISSLYWNPAGLSNMKSNEAGFTQTQWFAGVRQSAGGAALHIAKDHTLGLSLTRTGLPDIKVTTETQPLGTGGYFRFDNLAAGLSYAYRFTEQFSAGVTVRYTYERLGEVDINAFTVDAGTFYWTGLGTTRFAVAVSNFSNQKKPSGDAPQYNGTTVSGFRGFDAPTVFRIGFAMDPILDSAQRLTLALQLNHPSDNAENYALGAEYALTFSDAFPAQIVARAGYKLNVEEEDISAGAGLLVPLFDGYNVTVDYAYTHFKTLGAVHRFGAGIQF